MLDGSKDRAEALADQIKAALAELGETVSERAGTASDLVTERLVASLASRLRARRGRRLHAEEDTR